MSPTTIVGRVLASLLSVVAVVRIGEGILVLAGTRSPVAPGQGTLSPEARASTLLMVLVVGGSALLAAAAVFRRHAWGVHLAAAAGLILIVWELVEIAVGQAFSTIYVAIGLAVIAMAEYLWTAEGRGQPLPAMGHDGIRIVLLVLEAFIGTSAIDGGMALLRGAFDDVVSVAWLAGTPFGDYTIPSLVLVLVVGGSALLAAATVFIYREWAVLISVLAGLAMTVFLVVEAISIDGKVGEALLITLGMQLLYFVPGVTVFGLAGSLWMREYRRQHYFLRPA
jgi:hypothetical protein